MSTPLDERLANHVIQHGPDECWGWKGSLSLGYGQLHINAGEVGRTSKGPMQGHRVAYLLYVGKIPKDHTLDHTCHNGTDCAGGVTCPHRQCTNLRHLELVTSKKNKARGNSRNAINARKTHCAKGGHEFTPENTRLRGNSRGCRTCDREAAARSNAARKER